MAAVPNVPVAPPLSAEHLQSLRCAVAGFDYDQLLWTSGYLAGLARASAAGAPALPEPAAVTAGDAWTIFYATETGNCRRIAETLAGSARQAGVAVTVHDLRDYRPKALGKVGNALFIVATHGVGEPPDGTEMFFEHWLSARAARLEQLKFSVLALGDSSYADFCATGRALDERLQALGATRIIERIECDLDYEDAAAAWSRRVVERAAGDLRANAPPARAPHLHAVPSQPVRARGAPFGANILVDQRITGRAASKDIRHIELDLADSGIAYLPGDALAIVPRNPPQLVTALLATARLDGTSEVIVDGDAISLADALTAHREITQLSRPLLEKVAAHHGELGQVLAERDRLNDFFATRQVIDLVADWPVAWQPQDLVDALRRLAPRLYSIASSPDANEGEAHLTVAVVHYRDFGREHWGAASNYLASGVTQVPVYVEANERFRLPANGDTPIIMIGAGTGVAPYRAFVEHRREHGHAGDNWLIFGERNFATDFLYQLEWQRHLKEGWLARLDVAFSRDQAEKIYVQHRIREQSRRVYDWLERGAHVYVCGDATRMAVDVHEALVDAVAAAAGMTAERALEYVNDLKSARRYLRDVY